MGDTAPWCCSFGSKADDAQSSHPSHGGRLRTLPSPAGRVAIVTAEVECRRLISLDPEPEQIVVASQIDLRPGGARVAPAIAGLLGAVDKRSPAATETGRAKSLDCDTAIEPARHCSDLRHPPGPSVAFGGNARGRGCVYCCTNRGQLAPRGEQDHKESTTSGRRCDGSAARSEPRTAGCACREARRPEFAICNAQRAPATSNLFLAACLHFAAPHAFQFRHCAVSSRASSS